VIAKWLRLAGVDHLHAGSGAWLEREQLVTLTAEDVLASQVFDPRRSPTSA
jgi:ribulose 1,5-bisphosphate carboxylase large subunit-like protein